MRMAIDVWVKNTASNFGAGNVVPLSENLRYHMIIQLLHISEGLLLLLLPQGWTEPAHVYIA
jgi:hypothetical protein